MYKQSIYNIIYYRTLDDIMYDDECRRYALAFDG